jgi:hypothetical protein
VIEHREGKGPRRRVELLEDLGGRVPAHHRQAYARAVLTTMAT